jgi:hypothetical protein
MARRQTSNAIRICPTLHPEIPFNRAATVRERRGNQTPRRKGTDQRRSLTVAALFRARLARRRRRSQDSKDVLRGNTPGAEVKKAVSSSGPAFYRGITRQQSRQRAVNRLC